MNLRDLTTRDGHPDAGARRVYHDTLVAARFCGIPWHDAHYHAMNNALEDWRERYPDRDLENGPHYAGRATNFAFLGSAGAYPRAVPLGPVGHTEMTAAATHRPPVGPSPDAAPLLEPLP